MMPERPMAPHPATLDASGERIPFGPGETILVDGRQWAGFFRTAEKHVRNAPTMELRAVAVSRNDGVSRFVATDGNKPTAMMAIFPTHARPIAPGEFTPSSEHRRDSFVVAYKLLSTTIATISGCLGENVNLTFTTHGPERAVCINAATPAGLRATAVLAGVRGNRHLLPAVPAVPYEELQRQIDELTQRLAAYESK